MISTYTQNSNEMDQLNSTSNQYMQNYLHSHQQQQHQHQHFTNNFVSSSSNSNGVDFTFNNDETNAYTNGVKRLKGVFSYEQQQQQQVHATRTTNSEEFNNNASQEVRR